jgi:hypothetical protein
VLEQPKKDGRFLGGVSLCSCSVVDLVVLVEGRSNEAQLYSTDPLVIDRPVKDLGFLGGVSLSLASDSMMVVVVRQAQLGFERFQLVVAQTSCRPHVRVRFACMVVAVLEVAGFQVVAASVAASVAALLAFSPLVQP